MIDAVFSTPSTEPDTAILDENHINTIQELLNAVGSIPGVFEQVQAYMIARDIDDPKAELHALSEAVF